MSFEIIYDDGKYEMQVDATHVNISTWSDRLYRKELIGVVEIPKKDFEMMLRKYADAVAAGM